MAEDDDPVVASYDVVLKNSTYISEASKSHDSKLLILQYPAHRPSSRPYSAARSQKPQALRVKPKTGLLEVDVPILTQENYNADAGSRYGQALFDSRTLQVGGSHGLGGGFSNNAAHYNVPTFQNIPAHDNNRSHGQYLKTQTLSGKITKAAEKDPVYFLARFENGAFHLSHLDSVVQMRPQLQHIDAAVENDRKALQAQGGAAGGRTKPGQETAPAKLESKAIEVKMKDSKDDARDRGLNEGARLLRNIQADVWNHYEWIGDDEDDDTHGVKDDLVIPQDRQDLEQSSLQLKSVLSNSDWLDRMSAPREDGKKGLLAKLRGRERERARRKKAEEEKKLKSKTSAPPPLNAGPLLDQSSDSDLSSPEVSDLEDVVMHDTEVIEIKDESEVIASGSLEVAALGTEANSRTSTRSKVRSKKTPQGTEAMEIED